MKQFRLSVWTILTLLLVAPAVVGAQVGDCAAIVKTALDATKNICSDTTRNQACYGHVSLDAQAQTGLGPLEFNKAGDRVDLAEIDSLRLSPMNVTTGNWGVALLELQADIPDQQKNANVSLLLFGDVQIKNAVKNPTTMNATIAAIGNVNVRRQADNKSFVMATLHPGDNVTVTGRSADNQWVYIDVPGSSERKGWINYGLVKLDGSIDTLNVARPDLQGYGPMQAFYLNTGANGSSCSQASNDGILVQTPEGVAEVRLWINEVRIRLGSTAFIQASPNKQMVVNTVEGEAHVEAYGVEEAVPAGSSVTIPMDENLAPAAAPSKPHAYVQQQVANIPVQNLNRQIVVATPFEPTPDVNSVVVSTTTEAPAAEQTLEPTVTASDTDIPTVAPSDTDVPTAEVTDTVVPPTAVPPTAVPPTAVPPTDIPPTAVPPTAIPPTAVPPTAVPPTSAPPSDTPPPEQTSSN